MFKAGKTCRPTCEQAGKPTSNIANKLKSMQAGKMFSFDLIHRTKCYLFDMFKMFFVSC